MRNLIFLSVVFVSQILFAQIDRKGNGGNDIAFEFYKSAKVAIEMVQKSPGFPEVQGHDLVSILDKAKITVTKNPLFIGSREKQIEVVAINYSSPLPEIVINGQKWNEVTGQKKRQALALHEVLGLAGIEFTGYYEVSQRYYMLDSASVGGLVGNQLMRQTLNEVPVAVYYNGPLITVIIFNDYEAPYPELGSTLDKLIKEYALRGVEFVVKNFPISTLHPNAREAALAGICATRQNKFPEMHKLLVENGSKLHPNIYSTLAKTIPGMRLDQFSKCLSSPIANMQLQADLIEAKNSQVWGTPQFLFNSQLLNKRLSGNYPIETLRDVLEEMLKKFRP